MTRKSVTRKNVLQVSRCFLKCVDSSSCICQPCISSLWKAAPLCVESKEKRFLHTSHTGELPPGTLPSPCFSLGRCSVCRGCNLQGWFHLERFRGCPFWNSAFGNVQPNWFDRCRNTPLVRKERRKWQHESYEAFEYSAQSRSLGLINPRPPLL